MLCMSDKDQYIYGDYNSLYGRLLYIVLKKCSGKSYCLSESEIESWIKKHRYIIFETNIRRFDPS